MPSTTTATRPRRKTIYHIHNWPAYDRALVQRGAQFEYSDQAIEAVLTLKEVFHLTNREAEGLVRSVVTLMQVALAVPDHSTLSQRGRTVQIRLPKQTRGPLHVVMDSSGLKVFGEGEWKVRQHGWLKRRTWRKMHLSIEVTSGEVQAAMLSSAGVSDAEMVEPMLAQIDEPIERLTADGAYDKRAVYVSVQARAPDVELVIPPRHNARIWQHGNTHAPPHPRDEALRLIRKQGRHQWKEQAGYHHRSLAETAVFRFKTIFGDHLSTRLLATQATQFGTRCRALNIMTHLGMPDSFKVD